MLRVLITRDIIENINNLKLIGAYVALLSLCFLSFNFLKSELVSSKEDFEYKHQLLQSYDYKLTEDIALRQLFPKYPTFPIEAFLRNNITLEESSFFNSIIRKMSSPFDFTFISTVLLSFISIVFTYNLISGDKSLGILKLIHSYAVPRYKLVFSKWLVATLLISISYLSVILLMLIIAEFSPQVSINADVVITLMMFWVASCIYCGFFCALGILASTLFHSSNTSAIFALFAWTSFVFIIPNIAPILSSQLAPLPTFSGGKIINQVNKNRQSEEFKARQKLAKKYGININNNAPIATQLNSITLPAGIKKELLDRSSELESKLRRVKYDEIIYKSKVMKGRKKNIIARQNLILKLISLASPTSAIKYFTTELSDQTEKSFIEYEKQKENFIQEVINPIMRNSMEKYLKEGGSESLATLRADYSAIPNVEIEKAAIAERIYRAMPYLLHISIFCILTLLLSIVIYNKYDVR